MQGEVADLHTHASMLHAASDSLGPTWEPARDAMARRADLPGNLGTDSLRLRILGEPASKANSRQLLKLGGRIRSVKSDKALAYALYAVRQIQLQCRAAKWHCVYDKRIRVTMTIHYASERPDLDESLVLDAMQKNVFWNDRQVREKHVFHEIDKDCPRAEVLIEVIA